MKKKIHENCIHDMTQESVMSMPFLTKYVTKEYVHIFLPDYENVFLNYRLFEIPRSRLRLRDANYMY